MEGNPRPKSSLVPALLSAAAVIAFVAVMTMVIRSIEQKQPQPQLHIGAARTPDPMAIFNSPSPYTRATLDETNALLTSTATSITAQVAGPSGGAGVTVNFNGAEVTRSAAGKRILPRTVTVTTAVHAASYKTGAGNALVVTGTYGGSSVTENLLLTLTNGGETIRGTLLYDDPTQITIAIPGQNDALGSWTFGEGSIGTPPGGALRGIKALSAATSVVCHGMDGKYDTLNLPALVVEPVVCARLSVTGGGDTTTAVGFTVYP